MVLKNAGTVSRNEERAVILLVYCFRFRLSLSFSTHSPHNNSYSCLGPKQTGYSYGFGFVNYLNEEAAQRAIKCLNGYPLRNKRLKVSYARPQSDDIKETNLYITNLPRTITEEQLDIIFGKYGTIVQKNILRDKLTGQPRGVAFVR